MSTHKENYYKNISDNQDLNKFMSMLSSITGMLRNEVSSALKTYYDFAFLWDEGREEAVAVGVLYFFNIFVSCCQYKLCKSARKR